MTTEDETKPPPDEGPRSFARFLEMLAYGRAQADASDVLHDVTTALHAESKVRHAAVTGSITLTLNLKVESGRVEVDYNVVGKTPKPRNERSHLFVTDGGNITADNPRQSELKFGVREVPQDSGESREVDTTPTQAREV